MLCSVTAVDGEDLPYYGIGVSRSVEIIKQATSPDRDTVLIHSWSTMCVLQAIESRVGTMGFRLGREPGQASGLAKPLALAAAGVSSVYCLEQDCGMNCPKPGQFDASSITKDWMV